MSSSAPTPERLSAMEEWANEHPDRLGETYMREILAAYHADVAAREKAESEREELRVMLTSLLNKGRRSQEYYQLQVKARALLARLKDGGA